MNFWERNGYYGDKSGDDVSAKNSHIGKDEPANGEKTLNGGKNGVGGVNVEDEIRRFSTMSNDELMAELMAKASTSRANGTLSVSELEKFYTVATMFMNTEQLTRLRALLNMLEK